MQRGSERTPDELLIFFIFIRFSCFPLIHHYPFKLPFQFSSRILFFLLLFWSVRKRRNAPRRFTARDSAQTKCDVWTFQAASLAAGAQMSFHRAGFRRRSGLACVPVINLQVARGSIEEINALCLHTPGITRINFLTCHLSCFQTTSATKRGKSNEGGAF